MEYKKAETLYIKFLREVHVLYDELSKLDNHVRVPFKDFWYLFDLDTASFEQKWKFDSWKTKVTLGFYELVHQRWLYWSETHDGWMVLPFNTKDLPYEYDLDIDTLIDILTDGELRYNDSGYYDVYEFDEYIKEIDDEDEAIEVFKRGLEQIKFIREDKIPKVNELCEEFRECMDTRKLIDDCEKNVLKVKGVDES